MKRRLKRAVWLLVGTVCCILLIGGCRHYEVEVVLNPDGSGTRRVAFTGDPILEKDSALSLEDFRGLFHLEEAEGWTLTRQTDSEDEKLKFEKKGRIDDLAAWHRQSGDIQIDGSITIGAHTDVGCRNTVVVETAEGPSGMQYAYKETFAWRGLKQAIVGFVSEQFRASMLEAYPFLSSEELAELRGLMAGHVALYRFDLPEDEEKAQQQATIESVTFYARRVVGRGHPEADLPGILDVTEAVIDDSDGALDRFIEENLPGVELAIFTDVSLRVQMPGPILETNAEEVEGRTAVWKIDLLDVVEKPVELFARSGVADE